MSRLRFLIWWGSVCLAFCGCGGATTTTASPPSQELPTYYYVGVKEVHLKSFPDPSSSDTALVKLNERVQSLKRQGSWFLVRTAGGQEGWAGDKVLEIKPVSDLYVRRWGVRLREAPKGRGRTVERLRLNDLVKLLEQNDQGWARVTTSRSQKTGWVEMHDLSTEKVVVRRRLKKPGQAEPATPETEAPPETAPPPPSSPAPSLISPAPAQAAPPPPARPKRRPELFEPL